MPSFFETLEELFIQLTALIILLLVIASCVVGAAMAVGIFIRLVRYFGGF